MAKDDPKIAIKTTATRVTPAPATTSAQQRVRMDVSNVKSAYCNFFTVRDNPNEVLLNFGFNQSWGQSQADMQVQLLQQVILHPTTARRLKDTLVAVFERRDRPRAAAAPPDSGKKNA